MNVSCFRAGGVHSVQTSVDRIPCTRSHVGPGVRDQFPGQLVVSLSPTHPAPTPRWALVVRNMGDDAIRSVSLMSKGSCPATVRTSELPEGQRLRDGTRYRSRFQMGCDLNGSFFPHSCLNTTQIGSVPIAKRGEEDPRSGPALNAPFAT